MKRVMTAAVVIMLALAVGACGSKPSGVLEKMQGADVSSIDGMARYYTKGTVDAMKELDSLAPKTEKGEAAADKKFAKGAKWKVVEEKINGDAATVKIKYTDHPVENMKGLEITLHMKKEGGQWKIDMENEMKETISMIKAMNKNRGFLDQMRKLVK